MTTSARSTMSLRSRSRSVSSLRFTTTERLLRLKLWNVADAPAQNGGPQLRASSPSTFSTLMTSAPRSPRISPAYGAATLCPSSTTVTPSSGRDCSGMLGLGKQRDQRRMRFLPHHDGALVLDDNLPVLIDPARAHFHHAL